MAAGDTLIHRVRRTPTSCVALSKVVNLSELRLPHLENGHHSNTHLRIVKMKQETLASHGVWRTASSLSLLGISILPRLVLRFLQKRTREKNVEGSSNEGSDANKQSKKCNC